MDENTKSTDAFLLTPRKISRRQLLKIGTGAVLGAVGIGALAGCGQGAATTSPTSAPKAAAAPPTAAPEKAAAAAAQPTAASAASGTVKRVLPEDVAGPGPLSGKTIKIGVVVPLSGPQARAGLEIKDSVQWPAEQINAKGGLLGAKIEVDGGDDQADPSTSQNVAQRFVSDSEVMAIVGPYNSANMMPVSNLLNKVHMACVGTSTSNPQITERGLNNVFRVCSRDDYGGRAAGIYAAETLKATKMTAIDDQTTFGRGVADEFAKKLQSSYPDVTLTRAVIRASDADYHAVLDSLPKATEVVYFGGYAAQAALIAKQMKDVGLDKAKLIGCDGLYDPDFIKDAGAAAEGAVTFAFAPPPDTVPESKAFIQAMEKKLGGPTAYANNSYDAAMIIFTAIKRAGKLDRDAIRAEIAKTHDFYGFSTEQPITFNSKGDNQNASVFAYEVKDGKFNMLQQIPNSKLVS